MWCNRTVRNVLQLAIVVLPACKASPYENIYVTPPEARADIDLTGAKSFCAFGSEELGVMSAEFARGDVKSTVSAMLEISRRDSLLARQPGKSMEITAYAKNYMQNAVATFEADKRVIIYDGVWFAQLDQQFSPWAYKGILAHEVGHHYHWDDEQNHAPSSYFTQSSESNGRWQGELEADSYAGYILAKMSATKEEAGNMMEALETMGAGEGSETHPPTQRRRKALHAGWKLGGGKSYSERNDWCPCNCNEHNPQKRYEPDYEDTPDSYRNEDVIYRRQEPPPRRDVPDYEDAPAMVAWMPVPCQHPHPLNGYYSLHAYDLMPVFY